MALPRSKYPYYPSLNDQQDETGGCSIIRCSFAEVLSDRWNQKWDRICLGTGQAISQSGGNGVITSGTTANAETIMRYRMFISGSFVLRGKITLSQRIANNNFFIELVDIIGTNLPCTINSSVSITVTLPNDTHSPFSAENIGQGIQVGNIVGAAGIPMRATVASVDTTGRALTLTVSGWPASGSCTVDLFGWNHYKVLYDGTTATSAKFDTQRKGWNSGDTTATINTTASPQVFSIVSEDMNVGLLDTTANSTTWTQRAQRTENIPDLECLLALQVRVTNGTSNPASSTTFTIGFLGIDIYDPSVCRIGGQAGFNGSNTINIASVPSNQTINLAQLNGGTVATGNGTSSSNTLRVALVSDQTTNTNPLLVGGTGSTSIGKARDGASGASDTVVPTAAIRRSIPTAVTPAAGDYEALQLSDKGGLWTAKQGAPSSSHTISAASTNATNSKGSAGILHDISVNNINAAVRYLKLYDKSTAPTVGTDTPKRVIAIPAGASINLVLDIEFTSGIGWALTTGIANADTGAVAANEHVVGLSWF